jgi:hypothetical protein
MAENGDLSHFHLGGALVETLRWLRATNTAAHAIRAINDH